MSLNNEFEEINKTLTTLKTNLEKSKSKIEKFEQDIKKVETLKTEINNCLDQKITQMKKDIKKEVEDKFKAIDFSDKKKDT